VNASETPLKMVSRACLAAVLFVTLGGGARYANGMAAGQAAIVEPPVGREKVVVLGTDPGVDALPEIQDYR